MRCRKVQRWLSDYAGGDFGRIGTDAVEVHLKECKACAQHLAGLKKADELIRLKVQEGPGAEYWDSFWLRLKPKLENASPASGQDEPEYAWHNSFLRGFRSWQACMNAAFAVLLVLAAGLLYRSSLEVGSLRAMLDEQKKAVDALRQDLELPARIASAAASERSSQFRIFREVRDMFPRMVRWMVTDGGKVDVGLYAFRQQANASGGNGEAVFLKLHVLRSDGKGEAVSSASMIVLPDNEVSGTLNVLPDMEKAACSYRCLPALNARGGIDVSASVSLGDSVLRTVVSAGDAGTVELGRLRSGPAEYSVYLSVFTGEPGGPDAGSEMI